MNTAFQWQESYSVKIHAMDNQHKKLFEVINELRQAMVSGTSKDFVAGILDRLNDYTAYHFAAEEKLMEHHKFPGLPTHRGEHKYFIERLHGFKKDFDAGNSQVTTSLLMFLQRWLTNHVQVVDKNYSHFLNAKGVH